MNQSFKAIPVIVATLVLALTTSSSFAAINCMSLTGCERAICEKEQELNEAQAYNDISKVLGIQNSLVHLRTGCANAPDRSSAKYNGKLAELKKEYQDDLVDAFDDYQDDIKEAQREGKAAKLQQAEQKYDQKVQTVTAEYHEKLANLNALYPN